MLTKIAFTFTLSVTILFFTKIFAIVCGKRLRLPELGGYCITDLWFSYPSLAYQVYFWSTHFQLI